MVSSSVGTRNWGEDKMKLEIWKNVEDYPNYQISNFGNVKSKGRYVKLKIKKNV